VLLSACSCSCSHVVLTVVKLFRFLAVCLLIQWRIEGEWCRLEPLLVRSKTTNKQFQVPCEAVWRVQQKMTGTSCQTAVGELAAFCRPLAVCDSVCCTPQKSDPCCWPFRIRCLPSMSNFSHWKVWLCDCADNYWEAAWWEPNISSLRWIQCVASCDNLMMMVMIVCMCARLLIRYKWQNFTDFGVFGIWVDCPVRKKLLIRRL